MAFKKQEEPPKGSPAWMATFSDLMNLLLCFFVLLFSMSSVDQQKFQEIAASLASSFSIFDAGSTSLGEGILISSGVAQLNELAEYYENMGLNTEGTSEELNDAKSEIEKEMIAQSERMADNISELLTGQTGTIKVEVVASKQYVAINMRSGLLFDSGSADLRSEASEILDAVGQVLGNYPGYTIQIIGHTDNLPTDSDKYPDNNVLSYYRAYSVYKHFRDALNMDVSHFVTIARGDQAPVASNSTEEGRTQNRRVEIRIYNELSGM